MPDRERKLERELRELGALIYYPPTPEAARTARSLLDEEANDQPRRFRMAFPAMRWAVVAAAFVLIVAVPTLSPGLRAAVSDWFVAEDIQSAARPAVDAGSPERQSEADAPAAGVSKSGSSPALAPRFSEERISLREARARMDGAPPASDAEVREARGDLHLPEGRRRARLQGQAATPRRHRDQPDPDRDAG
jgi:hypothetical protein